MRLPNKNPIQQNGTHRRRNRYDGSSTYVHSQNALKKTAQSNKILIDLKQDTHVLTAGRCQLISLKLRPHLSRSAVACFEQNAFFTL